MPALLPVTPSTVNYAPVVFVGFVSISAAWYFVWGRKHYRGPPTETIGLVDPMADATPDDTVKK